MASNTVDQATISIVDASGETSNTRCNVPKMDIISFANGPANFQLIDAFITSAATNDFVLGNIYQGIYNVSGPSNNPLSKPVDQQAQRENKWIMTFQDLNEFLPDGTTPNGSLGKFYNYELATANLDLLSGNDLLWELPAPPPSGLETVWTNANNLFRNAYGQTMTLTKVRFAGRNR